MVSRSSVEASPIGAFVAWSLAAASSAQFALFLEGVLGKPVWLAWGIALLAFGWGARLASTLGRDRTLITSQLALMAAPVVFVIFSVSLSLSALTSFAGGFLGIFAVGWGLAVPVAQWIAGTAPPRPDGRPAAPPLPGASFAIALFFALPAPRLPSAVAGMAAVAALVLAASLGAISGRTTEGGSVAAPAQLWTRWASVATLLAASAGLIGFFLSNSIHPRSLLGSPMDVPPLPKNGKPTSTNGSTSASGRPLPDTTGSVNPSPPDLGDPSAPKPAPDPRSSGHGASPSPPDPDTHPERDWREYLKLAAVALLALAALALAKRYGDRIQALLARLFGRWAAPFLRLYHRWERGREAARLWQRANALPDPFAPPATEAARVARLEATLAALNVPRLPAEPPALHLRRAAGTLGGDAERWQGAIRAINRIRFSPLGDAGEDGQALTALDEALSAQLAQSPEAEARRREVRLALVRDEATSPEPAPL